MLTIADEDLPLQQMFRREREDSGRRFLTQPSGGRVRTWTWAEAVGEARHVATYLRSQGWEPGSRIAILSKNCAWWIMSDFAIWMAGHVSVPVYASLRPDSVRYILEHSGARACFIGAVDDAAGLTAALPPGIAAIRFPSAAPGGGSADWQAVVNSCPALPGAAVREANDTATIIYTSGTTGTPKGVIHTFSALTYDAKCLSAVLHLNTDDRIVSYLPLAHILERAALEATVLQAGFQVFFSEGVDTFIADLQRARPTILLSVPRLLTKFQQGVFAKTPEPKLDKLFRIAIVNRLVKKRILRALGLTAVRYAACGAAPLPRKLLDWWRRLGLELSEGYGMTEIMITHLGRPGSVRPGCVGSPIDVVEQKLGPDGELLIKSPTNLAGYYRDPEATLAAFTPDGFFRTGDLARIDPDGQVAIIGRAKEQFKTSKGKYIAPAPIENRLAAHPDVDACCLMGAGLPRPLAILSISAACRERCTDPEARRAFEQSLHQVLDGINREVEAHERVGCIVIANEPWSVANGLLTPTLKVRRSVLESRYKALAEKCDGKEGAVLWEGSL